MIQSDYKIRSVSVNDLSNDGMEKITEWLIANTTSDDIFIDLGAQCGCISIPVVDIVHPHLSIMVEANAASFKCLEYNFKYNIKHTDYKLFNNVVLDKSGECEFYTNNSSGTIIDRWKDGSHIPQKYSSICLNDILDELKIGDRKIVMKVDVELAEPFIWKGMDRYFKNIKAIVMEFFTFGFNDSGLDLQGFLNQIRNDGFQIKNLGGKELKDETILSQYKIDAILSNDNTR